MEDHGALPDGPEDDGGPERNAAPPPDGPSDDGPFGPVAPLGRRRRALLRDIWPAVMLVALAAGTAALAAARGAAPPGRATEAADVEPEGAGAPAVPDIGAGNEAADVAERVLCAAGTAALVVIALARRARRFLLPPPGEAPRATWGPEQLLYGLVLAFGTLVVVSAAAGLFPEGSAIAPPLLQAAGQLLIAATVVALVLTRPCMFPRLFGSPAAGLPAAGSWRDRLASVGLSPRYAGPNALRGLLGTLAAFPLAVAAGRLGAYVHTAATGTGPPVHPVVERIASAAALEAAVLVAVACVAAPVLEELFFRGFLYPSARDALGGGRLGLVAGALASSVVFAAFHPGLPNQMATFVLGFAFCLVYERAGTLAAPVVAHALFNAIELAFVLVFRAPG